MGAWGTGPFDNDDSGDWLFELVESLGLNLPERSIELVALAPPERYVDITEAANAIAAAETLAALIGRPHTSLPEEVHLWLDANALEVPSADLLALARRAITRVRTDSELQQLWGESPDFPAWDGHLQSLISRLAGPATDG